MFLYVGFSQIITNILSAARVPHAGSHEFPLDVGAARFPLHSLLDIGGFDCLRCATEQLHRFVRYRDTQHCHLCIQFCPDILRECCRRFRCRELCIIGMRSKHKATEGTKFPSSTTTLCLLFSFLFWPNIRIPGFCVSMLLSLTVHTSRD